MIKIFLKAKYLILAIVLLGSFLLGAYFLFSDGENYFLEETKAKNMQKIKDLALRTKNLIYYEATIHNPPGDIIPDQWDEELLGKIKTEIKNQKDFGNIESSGAKKISMIAKQWAYEPGVIEVNKGDKVIIAVKSVDVPHSFTLADFGESEYGPGINEFLEPGKEIVVQFVADKSGEFYFGCDVACGKGHSKMLGKLIVR